MNSAFFSFEFPRICAFSKVKARSTIAYASEYLATREPLRSLQPSSCSSDSAGFTWAFIFLSDVIACYAAGAIWLTFCILMTHRRKANRKTPLKPAWLIASYLQSARKTLLWAEEARDLVLARRSLSELDGIGPYLGGLARLGEVDGSVRAKYAVVTSHRICHETMA